MFDFTGGFMTFVLFVVLVYVVYQQHQNSSRVETLEKESQYFRDKLTQLAILVERLRQQPPAAPSATVVETAPQAASPEISPGIPPASPLPPASPIPAAAPLPGMAPVTAPWGDRPQGTVAADMNMSGEDVLWADEPATAKTAPQRPNIQQPKPATGAHGGKTTAASLAKAARNSSFEFQFGKKLPVWIGGIALALAGFYLVKYTIEKNLLTEEVRIFLGLAFGLGLAVAGRFIREHRPNMADGVRIAQALTGAAIADLYATNYAAVSVWHVASPAVGFFGMALITCFAVVLSLRHGLPIAILGLVGGYLTPMMISSPHPSAVPLFVYLYLLIAGFFFLVRRQGWWILSVPVVLLGFLWVPLWIFSGHFTPDDGLCLGLFIVATCATIAAQSRRAAEEATDDDAKKADNTATIAAAGGLAAMGLVTLQSDFGLMEWGMYWLLGLGGMFMAYFRPQVYRHMPPLSLGVTLLLLALWSHAADGAFAATLLAFAALYAGGSLVFYRLLRSFYWAAMLSASAIMFYGLGFLRLRSTVYSLINLDPANGMHFWGALALLLALFFAGRTGGVYVKFEGDEKLKDRLLAIFSLMCTAFLSLALLIEVHNDFMAVAFAAETLAVAWVYQRLAIPALRQIAAILLAAFALLMAPQFLLLGAVALHSLFGFDIGGGGAPSFLTEPFVQLGLPMAMVGYASYLLRRGGDDKIVEVFEYAAVALGALLAYYLSRLMFHVPADVLFRKAGFFERSFVTNVFFGLGMLLVYSGRMFERRALMISGTVIFFMALFRVFWFDVFIGNPLWSRQTVGEMPVFNALLLAYGAPLFWLWLESQPHLSVITWPKKLRGGIAAALGFLLLNLEVRQAFHGSFLQMGETSNAETYSYSAAWLLCGIALLVTGTARGVREWRIASLVLTTAAVGKVFLYDARELEGLFRVFSFMGLGLCMIALSWFYTRFVFNDKE